jgi:hypothetical protein
MRRRWPAASLLAALAALGPVGAQAHEERLMIGTVVQIEPARRLLVVKDARRDERRRLEVNAETEVLICGSTTGPAGVSAGNLVRVKYLDRPGSAPAVLSVLVLGSDPRR